MVAFWYLGVWAPGTDAFIVGICMSAQRKIKANSQQKCLETSHTAAPLAIGCLEGFGVVALKPGNGQSQYMRAQR
jgi:hypothetical protein